ncbi:short-chain dehydrogenase [Mycolicibacterium aromaticivorans JS19b1 = JCM 16368]|uniref:Short-chain dehydrogenase n=1 Tax=Mycolicibacterium aromaticivorans JS19b1 = JCM 16368 TaxID=1440774 RepID=A0A064CM68_9MYCO|nr:SDR family oxidoreductase [Mycolicibacterium aromaticivorans]KDF01446.1 short-chain dehydrogenase [Mycolicibacterium aromaticivorans JS19b1 = JCM 16368]
MAGLLQDKVVVITGVGPGLGTTLATRCAQEGADLVLAARSASRLDEVAKNVTNLGRRAVSVPTDITVDGDVHALAQEALCAYGKIDGLVNNAFMYPSMKPFAGTTFTHIRDSFELTVLGALRTIQAFSPALAESRGSIVNLSSMVIRHSEPQYGPYKLAKSALLAMSQSLSSELGGSGIRVNSVAPGYIWGQVLKDYFQQQAETSGVSLDAVYAAAAAPSDLKRLVTEDDVSSAIIFLISDLANGITGQTVDVNCGEHKA